MTLYRIVDNRYSNDLNGTGGPFTPGRWNRRGTSLVYLADHVSLAIVEVPAHSPGLPEGRDLVTVKISDDATVMLVDTLTLPCHWRQWPYPDELADLIEQWILDRNYWIMRVSSAIAPSEFIYLLNPLHPEHKTLELISIEPHLLNPRLNRCGYFT